MSASQPSSAVRRIIKVGQGTLALAAIALLTTNVAQGAQAGKSPAVSARAASPELDLEAVAPAAGTNTAVGRIQTDLKDVIAKVEAATKQMSMANAASPSQYSAIVSNTAIKIRELATQTLGDNSQIVKEADGLIQKTRGQISRVRGLSTDPKNLVRSKYETLLPSLEKNLSQVMDARSSVGSIRAELLKQADALGANAEFIGFSEDVAQGELAIKAFRDCLSEVSAFVARLSKTIDDVGGPKLARFD
jgi:hypothetical protein